MVDGNSFRESEINICTFHESEITLFSLSGNEELLTLKSYFCQNFLDKCTKAKK